MFSHHDSFVPFSSAISDARLSFCAGENRFTDALRADVSARFFSTNFKESRRNLIASWCLRVSIRV